MTAGGSGCVVCKIVKLLAGIGALNWGLMALWQVDLVAKIFGSMTTASRIVYIVVGVAGLITLVTLVKPCPCEGGSCETKR